MLNPEDFRRQLEEGLNKKRRADRQEAKEEKGQAKIQKQIARQEEKQAKQEEKERNRLVVELDRQLPIGQALETLRNKIAPLEHVRRFGPKGGKIAYVLPYRVKHYEITRKTSGSSSNLGGAQWIGQSTIVDESGIEWQLLVAKLASYKSPGEVGRWTSTPINDKWAIPGPYEYYADASLGSRSIHVNSLLRWPLTLNPFSKLGPDLGTDNLSSFRFFRPGPDLDPDNLSPSYFSKYFNLDREGEAQRFTQEFTAVLTDFYVGLKTG